MDEELNVNPVKRERLVRNYTLRQFSSFTGINPVTISDVENGYIPKKRTLLKLASKLDIPPDKFVRQLIEWGSKRRAEYWIQDSECHPMKRRRWELGIGVREFASFMKISGESICGTENRGKRLSIVNLKKCANFLRCDPLSLLWPHEVKEMNLLRQKRILKGYTLNVLSRLTGIAAPYLWKLEVGTVKSVRLKTVTKLATALACEVVDLVDKKGKFLFDGE